MNARLSIECFPFRVRTGLAGMFMLLAVLAGCATAPKHPGEPSSMEPVVSRLDDGRQGFRIEEHAEPDGKTRNDFANAVDFMEQARYDEAITLLEQVIERSPGLTAPHINIALAYEQKEATGKAEEHLKTALDLIPGHPVASNAYGLLLRNTGRFTEARDIFEKALDRFPDYLPLRKNLGILCELYLDDPACALEQFEVYSEAAPDDAPVEVWIASLRQRIESRE